MLIRFSDAMRIVGDFWKKAIDEYMSRKKEEIDDLGCRCLSEDIENGTMESDLSGLYPHDEQSWIQGYMKGFHGGYKEGKKRW